MSVMSKNVNLVLLLLLFIAIAGIAAVSTYYQKSYLSLLMEHEQITDEFNETKSTLSDKTGKLLETELMYKQQEETNKEYDTLYAGLKQDKELVDSELAVTKEELNQKSLSLAQTITELSDKITDLVNTQILLASARATIGARDTTITSLRSDVESLENQLASCQGAGS